MGNWMRSICFPNFWDERVAYLICLVVIHPQMGVMILMMSLK